MTCIENTVTEQPQRKDNNGVTCISPTGENERGLKMIREVTPNIVISPHLTSPVGEGQMAMPGESC